VSATADPEAAYGKAYGAMSFAFAVLLLGVPHLQELWGERLLFGLMAGFVLMACPGLRHLHPAAAAGTPPIAATRVAWRDVLWLSLAITLSFLLNGGVYAWSEPVAEAVGASPQLLGAALAGSMLCSAAGATLASRLGQRAGRSGPLGVCMALAGVSYALVLGAGSVATLVAGLLLYGLVTLFFTAYANGAAAAIDPQGRVATALQGYALLAYAAGPGLFSELAHVLSPRLFGALALLANLLAFALFLPVTRRLDRRPPAPGPDAAPR
jgi:MFS family permease